MVIFVVCMDFGWYVFMLFRCFHVFLDKTMDPASLSRTRAPVTVSNCPLLVFTGSAPPRNRLHPPVVTVDEGSTPKPDQELGGDEGYGMISYVFR